MPNPPINPSILYGLQKASSIGADPTASAFRDMREHTQLAAISDPKNDIQSGANGLQTLIDMGRKYYGPVQETLGENHPDYTPMGGEGMFNIARSGVNGAKDALESAYHSLMPKFGGIAK